MHLQLLPFVRQAFGWLRLSHTKKHTNSCTYIYLCITPVIQCMVLRVQPFSTSILGQIMAWSSKAVVLFVVVSLLTIPVQSQRSRSNRNSSSSLSSGAIGAIVTLSVVICGCCLGVCCVCWVYHSDKNQGQHRGAPPRAFVSNNNARYPRATTQQTPTVVYNTGYSQTPIYYHGNAGTASNGPGQQFSQPVYYATVNHQASTSGDSGQQDTRYNDYIISSSRMITPSRTI